MYADDILLALRGRFEGYISMIENSDQLIGISYRIKYQGIILYYRFDFCRHVDFVVFMDQKAVLDERRNVKLFIYSKLSCA